LQEKFENLFPKVPMHVPEYSLRFKTKVTFGHNLHYETKGTFGEISLKLRQTNWNVAKNNVNVVVDELPSQSTKNLHLFNN
jgi:4-hydroxy-3-methylbut-2-enyl diphosphate reductase IspH